MAIDFDLSIVLVAFFLSSPVLWYFRKKKMYSMPRLIVLALFIVYLVGVASQTFFPIYIDSSMREAVGQNVWEHINLIPLADLAQEDVKTSSLNILLFVPFGFILPFLSSKARVLRVTLFGLILSVTVEFLQFTLALLSGFTLRFIDVNDIIFNVLGAFIGILAFWVFVRLFRAAIQKGGLEMNPVLEYVALVTKY